MIEQLPRIETAEVSGPHRLRVVWKDGRIDIIELEGMIADFEPFAPLRDPALFATVQVIEYGDGIAWDGGLDYGADSLRQLAEDQRAWTGEDMTQWQSHLGLSNQEAADLLGVALSTLKVYRAPNRPVPTNVKIACRALERDRSLFQAHYRPRTTGRPRQHASS